MKLSEINKLQREYKGTVWINNKTENKYVIKNIAYNATNERDGEIVAVYQPIDGGVTTFVRCFTEFKEKFTEIK